MSAPAGELVRLFHGDVELIMQQAQALAPHERRRVVDMCVALAYFLGSMDDVARIERGAGDTVRLR